MRRSTILLPFCLSLAMACNGPAETAAPAAAQRPETAPATTAAEKPKMSHEEEIMEWRANRGARLSSETGWLTLVGLQWLQEGENRLEKPANAGTVTLKNGVVTLAPNPALTIDGKPVTAPVVLLDDTNEKGPTMVQTGTVRFNAIKRADKVGIRVRDSQSETRKRFAGLENFPVDPRWRLEARFEPFDPPRKMPIANVVGITTEEVVPGMLVITVDGKEYRIQPIIEQGETDFFIIFKDATSGKETYPAARYVYAKPPGPDGRTIVDFNRAYNPPCVFTPYATCPLPPPTNRLPFRVEAGEKNYTGYVEGKH